jgi:hypothetical protein
MTSGYRFEEITLRTQDGKMVRRTARGDALCKSPGGSLLAGTIVVLESKTPYDFDRLFDLRDCFEITKAGTYILTIKARLYAVKGYQDFVILDLPEARLEVVLHEAEIKR